MLEHPDITQCLRTGHPFQKQRPAPVCDVCGERVGTEQYLPIFGYILCEDCVEKNKRYTEDWDPDSYE